MPRRRKGRKPKGAQMDSSDVYTTDEDMKILVPTILNRPSLYDANKKNEGSESQIRITSTPKAIKAENTLTCASAASVDFKVNEIACDDCPHCHSPLPTSVSISRRRPAEACETVDSCIVLDDSISDPPSGNIRKELNSPFRIINVSHVGDAFAIENTEMRSYSGFCNSPFNVETRNVNNNLTEIKKERDDPSAEVNNIYKENSSNNLQKTKDSYNETKISTNIQCDFHNDKCHGSQPVACKSNGENISVYYTNAPEIKEEVIDTCVSHNESEINNSCSFINPVIETFQSSSQVVTDCGSAYNMKESSKHLLPAFQSSCTFNERGNNHETIDSVNIKTEKKETSEDSENAATERSSLLDPKNLVIKEEVRRLVGANIATNEVLRESVIQTRPVGDQMQNVVIFPAVFFVNGNTLTSTTNIDGMDCSLPIPRTDSSESVTQNKETGAENLMDTEKLPVTVKKEPNCDELPVLNAEEKSELVINDERRIGLANVSENKLNFMASSENSLIQVIKKEPGYDELLIKDNTSIDASKKNSFEVSSICTIQKEANQNKDSATLNKSSLEQVSTLYMDNMSCCSGNKFGIMKREKETDVNICNFETENLPHIELNYKIPEQSVSCDSSKLTENFNEVEKKKNHAITDDEEVCILPNSDVGITKFKTIELITITSDSDDNVDDVIKKNVGASDPEAIEYPPTKRIKLDSNLELDKSAVEERSSSASDVNTTSNTPLSVCDSQNSDRAADSVGTLTKHANACKSKLLTDVSWAALNTEDQNFTKKSSEMSASEALDVVNEALLLSDKKNICLPANKKIRKKVMDSIKEELNIPTWPVYDEEFLCYFELAANRLPSDVVSELQPLANEIKKEIIVPGTKQTGANKKQNRESHATPSPAISNKMQANQFKSPANEPLQNSNHLPEIDFDFLGEIIKGIENVNNGQKTSISPLQSTPILKPNAGKEESISASVNQTTVPNIALAMSEPCGEEKSTPPSVNSPAPVSKVPFTVPKPDIYGSTLSSVSQQPNKQIFAGMNVRVPQQYPMYSYMCPGYHSCVRGNLSFVPRTGSHAYFQGCMDTRRAAFNSYLNQYNQVDNTGYAYGDLFPPFLNTYMQQTIAMRPPRVFLPNVQPQGMNHVPNTGAESTISHVPNTGMESAVSGETLSMFNASTSKEDKFPMGSTSMNTRDTNSKVKEQVDARRSPGSVVFTTDLFKTG